MHLQELRDRHLALSRRNVGRWARANRGCQNDSQRDRVAAYFGSLQALLDLELRIAVCECGIEELDARLMANPDARLDETRGLVVVDRDRLTKEEEETRQRLLWARGDLPNVGVTTEFCEDNDGARSLLEAKETSADQGADPSPQTAASE